MLMQDIVEFLVYCVGFVAGFELVHRTGKWLAQKATGEANPAAATSIDPAPHVSDLERRQGKRRELLVTALTVAMVIAAYNVLLPPRPGFLAAVGAGAIVGVASLVARALMKEKP
jgi:hypothetical protein